MTDAQIIAKGNEMLADAGMPPLTQEQASAFLAKHHARKTNIPWAAWGLVGACAVVLAMEKNPVQRKRNVNGMIALGFASAGYWLGLKARST